MAFRARRGDLLFKLTPFVQAIHTQELDNFCSQCASEGKLLTCTACKVMRYCDTACQRQDWKTHKTECKCLQQVISRKLSIPDSNVRLILRIVIKMRNGETKLRCDEMQLRCFEDLMSHVEDINEDEDKMNYFFMLCDLLEAFTEGILTIPSLETLLQIFGKMKTNGFGLGGGLTNKDAGIAIYLSSSLLNHSCDPLAFIQPVETGNVQQIRAIRDFRYDRYSEITVSYIELCATSYERQADLRQRYYFTCQCRKCLDPTSDRVMTSSICPKEGCRAPIFQLADEVFTKCGKCGNQEYPDSYSESRDRAMNDCKDTVQQCVKLLENNPERMDLAKAYKISTMTYKTAKKVLHPYNVFLFRLFDVMFRISKKQGKYPDALNYIRAKIEPLNKYLPPSHPCRCWTFLEIGELEMEMGYFKQALKTVESVSETVYLFWGHEHTQSRILKSMIENCRRENKIA